MKTAKHNSNGRNCRYLTCPSRKGRPRKHVDVCRKCRRNRSCSTYQDYIQPGLFPGWR